MQRLDSEQQRVMCEAYRDRVATPSTLTAEGLYAAGAALLEWQARKEGAASEDELRKARDIGAKKSPRLVVCAIIFRDGKVLLERRAPTGTTGLDHKWDLPGGKVEINETPEEAIIREIAEELFVSVRATRMIPYLLTSKWTYADGEERHWILNAYVCDIIGGEPVCGTHLQWFDVRELPVDILDADRNLITVAKLATSPAPAEGAKEEAHSYTSTACQHHLHERCRQACKFCGARCACDCHQDQFDAPAAPRAESQDTVENLRKSAELCRTLEAAIAQLRRQLDAQDTVPRAVAVELLKAVKVSRNSQSRRDHTSCHSIPQVVLGSTTLTDFDNRCDQCKQADAAIARAKEAGLE